ncbi:DNA-protecting protein DprA [Shewanella algae]|uniref:DNA-processing protein DprA n=1 Tax=Shewanella algae TaxID=38313 RepID=UPI0020355BF1|nr:DNA-processing protein DprA [Shewanella algae]MCM2529700.1 DNA-protecting protein DprA [Shewanella algae]
MREHKGIDTKYWKKEIVAFCALQLLKGIGFKTLYKIAKCKMSFYELLFFSDPEYFQNTLGIRLENEVLEDRSKWIKFQKEQWDIGVKTAAKLGQDDIRVIFREQDNFPERLRKISPSPMWLFVQGSIENLHKPSVAIIGSRKSSEDGLWLTKFTVAALANLNIVTISGLAKGIDQKAHQESINFSIPTVAIIGTGIDNNYPAGSEKLRREIIDNGGTIVSEYLLGQSFSKENFVRRNRIQAGLANIVIPVEWNIKSGTAHTVNFSKDLNKSLIMPYLPNKNILDAELLEIKDYSKGKTFLIPQESEKLIDSVISSNIEKEYSSENSTQQLPFDL